MRVQANGLLSQRGHGDNNRNDQEKEIKPFHFLNSRYTSTAMTTTTATSNSISYAFIVNTFSFQ